MRLETGDQAPPFTLVDDEGGERSLEDYRGGKLIIYFYPRAFTPGCTTESCDFRDNHAALATAGYQILGISPDEPGRLADFRAEHDLPFPLLSGPDHEVAAAYGAWGTKKMYGKEREGLIRSTFAVGEDGRLEHAWYNVRAKGHVDRIQAEVA